MIPTKTRERTNANIYSYNLPIDYWRRNLIYSTEEKSDFIKAILENSLFNNREYYELITEVLMQIPDEELEKIDSSLDHIVVMRRGTYAAAENVRFTCMGKHETKIETNSKPFESVKPVYFHKYVVILGLDNMKKLAQTQKLAVIAEQFAHVYLNHEFIGGLEKRDEAAKLIKSWGFYPFLPPHASHGQRNASTIVQARDFEERSRT